jgi:hypothetical protein
MGIKDGKPGAVLFIQRHGSAINLNPHGHVVAPDGLFVLGEKDQVLSFKPLPQPTNEELSHLLERVSKRTLHLYQKTYGEEEVFIESDDLPYAQAISETLRVPLDPSANRIHFQDESPVEKELCVKMDHFSLHAQRQVKAQDRTGLEQLLRYGARAPIAAKRLGIGPDGLVTYKLSKPWFGGITELRLQPMAFLRRLAMLMPSPYTNMVRYYGVFASRSKLRPYLPFPSSSPTTGNSTKEPHDNYEDALFDKPTRTYRLPWAKLMKRVLGIDPLVCKRCSTPMVVLAFISDLKIVQKILAHLKIPLTVTPLPLPTPVQATFDFDSFAFPVGSDNHSQDQANLARAPPLLD